MIALLGARSDFSLGESLLSPEEIAKYAADNGYNAVSLTDTMNLSSMVRFGKACAKHNVQPIHGVRLRICDDALDKTPPKKRETKNREILIKAYALTDAGMERLYQLLSIAYRDDHFYYVPRLSLQEVCDALSQGGLAISSGDSFNAFGHPQGISLWRALASAVGASYAFLELCPVATPLYDRTNEIALREHTETGVSLLMTRPALYGKPEDADALDILSTITSAMKMTDPWRPIPWVRDFALQPFSTLRGQIAQCHRSINGRFPHDLALWASALANDRALIKMCEYRWSKRDISLPQMAQDESATLKALTIQGWQNRLTKPQLGYQPTDLKPYAERLVYELDTLQRLGFERYFLLVHDLVKWAKDNNIQGGPGRGSCAGSLVAYLLGITDVDPLRFGLIFERFINPSRPDLPDADLDFATSGRQQVVDYLVRRYGADCVAGITNYSTLASASALRDTARVHDLPLRDYDCTKLVPKVHGKSHELNQAADEVPEIEAFKLRYPTLWNHAVSLQGKMRAYGTHAAGVCVGGEQLTKRAPVITRSGFPTVAFDRLEVEDQGLVKIDVLGLSTLDILRIACELIERRCGKRIDLLDIPLDDPETLDAFGRGETNAVFQFGSSGIKQLLRDLATNKRLTFGDISAATALFRPGPLDSGLLDEYVAISQGRRVMSFDHPNMAEALKDTYGVMIFQENLMRVSRDLAGYTMAGAEKLRKIVGKKRTEEMAKERDTFIGGCVSHSQMDPAAAAIIFDKIEKFASYSFCAAHAYAYSVISFQSMWLKVHYRAEFYAASMSVLDSDKLPGIVRDAREDGINVLPPDINISQSSVFEPRQDQEGNWVLYTPFNRLKGLSDKTGDVIAEARRRAGGQFESVEQFVELVEKRRCNGRHQAILDEVGALALLQPGAIPSTDPQRLKKQIELMPGIIIDTLVSNRVLSRDPQVKRELTEKVTQPIFGCSDPNDPMQWLTEPCKRCALAENIHVPSRHGQTARVMVVSQHPSYGEADRGKMAEGLGSETLRGAIERAGMSVSDFYFTNLVKARPNKGQKLDNSMINACAGYLATEIELLKPTVIVALGSVVIRHLIKGVKGNMNELLDHVEFMPELDASIVCGPNPSAVHFHPEIQADVDKLLTKVAEMVGIKKDDDEPEPSCLVDEEE